MPTLRYFVGPGRALLPGAMMLLAAVTIAASRQAPPAQPPPRTPPVTDTRDPYLNPRETDISLGMQVDAAELPDVPPTEPADALKTFRVAPGFRLELVAHEPDVVDPVQMAFDEHGRLYVVEMRWYQSETRGDLMFDERIGRIRLLEDTDGDGRFDKSTIFADRLRYPSAVFPYDGGVYVGVEPDILFMKDTTGDGVADERRVVFTGFGNHRERLDSQMFMNSLAWGLDNRIHGAKGHGGFITSVAAASQPELDLRTRDFSFDPRTHVMRPESGGGKQGLSFDDYGHKFVCTQSTVAQVLMYEDRYAGRNPFYAPPRALEEIAREPDEHPDRQRVARISQEDPWRRIRNRWRAEGIFAGPPPQPPGYLTASTGVTLYRGHLYPETYRNSAFVGASANNLVHRRRIVADGVGFRALRAPEEANAEFLASTDMWFRPVAFANGPEGALYVADLYREIIDFSDGVPESIKRVKDLNRGNDRGRIYRVVPEGFTQPARPRLADASAADLVALLDHANGWHRETAARLLYERQAKGAIAPLVTLLADATRPVGRLHALYALAGLDALDDTHVRRALDDADAGVREHAVRLAERVAREGRVSAGLWDALAARADDEAPRVRYQLAFTLGELTQHPDRVAVLATLLARDHGEPWMHVAALTSLASGTSDVFTRLLDVPGLQTSASGRALLAEVMRTIGASGRGQGLLAVLQHLETVDDRATAFSWLAAFADGLARADLPLALFETRVEPLLEHARTAMRDVRAPDDARVQAIALVGLASPTRATLDDLLGLVAPEQPPAVVSAALAALSRLNDPGLGDTLLARWPAFTPVLRREVLPLLLARPERARALLSALDQGRVLRNELTPTQTALLRAHRDAGVRRLAARLLSDVGTDRAAVIARYQPSTALPGDPRRGLDVYRTRCASCHTAGDEGHALGPSVDGMRSSALEELLTHILDPSRAQDAAYRLYTVETTTGETLMGLIRSETASTVTLAQPFGAEQVVPRAQVARLQGLEQSIMPDGLEEGLSLQDMADLLRFLVSAP
jgi:putative membrane-bound dehydrogenase-like protein